MAELDQKKEDGGLMSESEPMESSLRPQPRPEKPITTKPKPRPVTEVTYDDIENIARLVYAEARGEPPEGQHAVISTIFNRLASNRWKGTSDKIIDSPEFDPVRTYKGVQNIPVPEDELGKYVGMVADFIHTGARDNTDGRTFWQNEEAAKKKGSMYIGQDPMVIGKHTFYKGYEDKPPVTDIQFAHNIQVVPEYSGKPKKAKGGLMSGMEKSYNSGGYVSANGLMGTSQYVVGIDEETGNEIPYGSTAENVADTIDAKLSEGEFVIPADVVRWYGVQHFVDMISLAKMQFMDMAMEEEMPEIEIEIEEIDLEDVDLEEEPKKKNKKESFGIKNTPKTVFSK
jgi:hypothetical protein